MTIKQNSSRNKLEVGATRLDKMTAKEALLQMKQREVNKIVVSITNRTSIELPAHLSKEQRDARVANYIRLHKSEI